MSFVRMSVASEEVKLPTMLESPVWTGYSAPFGPAVQSEYSAELLTEAFELAARRRRMTELQAVVCAAIGFGERAITARPSDNGYCYLSLFPEYYRGGAKMLYGKDPRFPLLLVDGRTTGKNCFLRCSADALRWHVSTDGYGVPWSRFAALMESDPEGLYNVVKMATCGEESTAPGVTLVGDEWTVNFLDAHGGLEKLSPGLEYLVLFPLEKRRKALETCGVSPHVSKLCACLSSLGVDPPSSYGYVLVGDGLVDYLGFLPLRDCDSAAVLSVGALATLGVTAGPPELAVELGVAEVSVAEQFSYLSLFAGVERNAVVQVLGSMPTVHSVLHYAMAHKENVVASLSFRRCGDGFYLPIHDPASGGTLSALAQLRDKEPGTRLCGFPPPTQAMVDALSGAVGKSGYCYLGRYPVEVQPYVLQALGREPSFESLRPYEKYALDRSSGTTAGPFGSAVEPGARLCGLTPPTQVMIDALNDTVGKSGYCYLGRYPAEVRPYVLQALGREPSFGSLRPYEMYVLDKLKYGFEVVGATKMHVCEVAGKSGLWMWQDLVAIGDRGGTVDGMSVPINEAVVGACATGFTLQEANAALSGFLQGPRTNFDGMRVARSGYRVVYCSSGPLPSDPVYVGGTQFVECPRQYVDGIRQRSVYRFGVAGGKCVAVIPVGWAVSLDGVYIDSEPDNQLLVVFQGNAFVSLVRPGVDPDGSVCELLVKSLAGRRWQAFCSLLGTLPMVSSAHRMAWLTDSSFVVLTSGVDKKEMVLRGRDEKYADDMQMGLRSVQLYYGLNYLELGSVSCACLKNVSEEYVVVESGVVLAPQAKFVVSGRLTGESVLLVETEETGAELEVRAILDEYDFDDGGPSGSDGLSGEEF